MLRLRFAFPLLLVGVLVLASLPVVAQDPPVIAPWVVTKAYDTEKQMNEYIYTLDYQHGWDYQGPICDFHINIGNWTPGQIEIVPPANWAGSYEGGVYGCQDPSGDYPITVGNYCWGFWKIYVRPGYGDGTSTCYFTDWPHAPGVVAQQLGVMIPAVPEPGSLLALGSGLTALLGMALRKRR
jgi:hypothetical protein